MIETDERNDGAHLRFVPRQAIYLATQPRLRIRPTP